jgi:hypothetical protein
MTDSQISTIDDQPEAAPKTKATKAQLKDAGIGDKRRTVTIHVSDADGGDGDVFIGVNGVAYQIKRGAPVQLPEEVIGALQDAVITTYRSGPDGKVKATHMPRFAFSVS